VSQFFPIAVGLRVGQREWACNAEKKILIYIFWYSNSIKNLSSESFDIKNLENKDLLDIKKKNLFSVLNGTV
jgi:hypothetical protein